MIIYPGTFNPVHIGHIKIVEIVSNLFRKEVTLIPAFDSPWKPDLKDNYMDRVNMITLSGLRASKVESILPCPSYTFQTVEYLHNAWNLRGRLDFVIGYDQFFQLEKWKHPEILKMLCHFIVLPRLTKNSEEKLAEMKEKGYRFTLIEMDYIPASSSEVRAGNLDLVVPAVKRYILDHEIYKF
jgi:nicotinate-nucleotide adenylyltransferase